MATVIGVRFKKAGKVYYFDPTDVWPKPGDDVIVETARGIEFGEVVTGARSVDDQQIVPPLKKVLRLATEEDKRRAEFNTQREKTAFSVCQEKIARHKLDMKLVSVEYTFDNSKIIFYFTTSAYILLSEKEQEKKPIRNRNSQSASFLTPLHFYIQSPFRPGTPPTMFHPQKP